MLFLAATAAAPACGLDVVGEAPIGGVGANGGSGANGHSDVPDAATASLAPARLPGRALWLVADDAVADASGKVVRWPDASGLGNDAVPVGSSAPVVVPGTIGGHAAVRFDGARSYLTIPSSAALEFGAGANPFALVVVVRYSAPTPDSRAVFSKLGSGAIGPLLLVQSGGPAGTTFSAQVAPEKGSGAFAPFPAKTGTTRVLVQWTPSTGAPGGTLSVRVGAGAAVTKALKTTTSLASSAPAYLGTADFGKGVDMFVAADVAEIVLWSPAVAIDAADVAGVEGYLDGKYAL